MRLNNPNILITRGVDASLLQQAISKGINVDVIQFIRTEIVRTKKNQQRIEYVLSLNTTVVFTSTNAVEAVAEYLHNKKPSWKIYCIDKATKNLTEKYFEKKLIAATANDAADLAKKILKNHEQEVYFFCGDKKRKELPRLLTQYNIPVNEIEVYTTTILKHTIEKDYDGILFFSPSAVDGFFESNSVNDKTILFAIGNTTADEVKKFSRNKIVVSDNPGKENLLEKMIDYFTNKVSNFS